MMFFYIIEINESLFFFCPIISYSFNKWVLYIFKINYDIYYILLACFYKINISINTVIINYLF